MTLLTQRFSDAVEYARAAHAGQVRKGSNIPYMYHLLAVSSLVLEYGGDEDQAIAGLLHDILEDCGAPHADEIRNRFGDAVLAIVKDCTDGTMDEKASAVTPEEKRSNWWTRKLAYIEHLKTESDASLLVGGATSCTTPAQSSAISRIRASAWRCSTASRVDVTAPCGITSQSQGSSARVRHQWQGASSKSSRGCTQSSGSKKDLAWGPAKECRQMPEGCPSCCPADPNAALLVQLERVIA